MSNNIMPRMIEWTSSSTYGSDANIISVFGVCIILVLKNTWSRFIL